MTLEQAEARIRLYQKAGKRSATLQSVTIDDVRFLKFRTVTAIKDAIERADAQAEYDIISAVFSDKGETYTPISGNEKEVVKFLMFITDGIRAIANMEMDSFDPVESDGVDTSKLEIFKELNIIDSIAGGDVLKWEAIQEQPYWNIFLKMLKTQEENKIEKARMEVSKNK